MMLKKISLIGAFALMCYAGVINDSDLDGVPDNVDICPNTPFLETVNKFGCSENQLKSLKKKRKIKFNLSFGYEYDHYNNYPSSRVLYTSLSAKKNNIRTTLFFSELNDGSGNGYKSNDLILSIYYYFNLSDFYFKMGPKVYFNTYYNDKMDYAFLVKGTYFFKNFDIALSEKHKIYGESDQKHKDTIMLELGAFYNKWYISPYVYTENSSYDTSKWYKYGGLTVYYQIDKKFSFTVDYSADLEETQNYTITSTIGYSF